MYCLYWDQKKIQPVFMSCSPSKAYKTVLYQLGPQKSLKLLNSWRKNSFCTYKKPCQPQSTLLQVKRNNYFFLPCFLFGFRIGQTGNALFLSFFLAFLLLCSLSIFREHRRGVFARLRDKIRERHAELYFKAQRKNREIKRG